MSISDRLLAKQSLRAAQNSPKIPVSERHRGILRLASQPVQQNRVFTGDFKKFILRLPRNPQYTSRQSPEGIMTRSMVWPKPAFLWISAIIFLSGVSALPTHAQEKSSKPQPKYNGSGSCSASACHGGAQITDIDTRKTTATHVWQNESFIWSTQDPHFKAFNTLQTDRSKKIWHILKESVRQSGNQSRYQANLPENEPQCLGCHALNPEPDQKARLVFPEGVSCESCHNA